MATKTTVLTVVATAILLLSGILAAVLRAVRTKEPVTLDQSYDDMRHRRHQEVLRTEFAPRSHGGQGEGDATAPS
jgi:hypothetical protein